MFLSVFLDAEANLFLTFGMGFMSRAVRAALIAIAFVAPAAAPAAEGFRLSAPAELSETGFLKYVLPRFSLKTGIRIETVDAGEAAEAALSNGAEGRAVFAGPGGTWRIVLNDTGHAGAARFADWLGSDVGQRTITGFKIDDQALFTTPQADAAEVTVAAFEGDAKSGMDLSHRHCGRCHVVSDGNRMNSIGSTPSFFVLRTFSDWDRRFRAFFVLNPHPAFTQVAGVTEPFPISRPPPIIPVEITVDELDDILAYVAKIAPADLGAPIEHQ